MALPTTPRKPDSVQPGGGWCMRLELAWGRCRRALLRRFRPGYVRQMLAKRQGSCGQHDDDVIDARDLKYLRNVCALWFRPEDDRFQWRGQLGLARYGLAHGGGKPHFYQIHVGAAPGWALGHASPFAASRYRPAP